MPQLNLLKILWNRIRKKGFLDTVVLLCHIGGGIFNFYLNPFVKKVSKIPPPDLEEICCGFKSGGIEVIPYKIDINEFREWLKTVNFPMEYKDSYRDVFVEKALEHYISTKLLELQESDIFIDIAAANSPWYEIVEKVYNCKSYALDINFPKGIKDKKIGANAISMPLPNEFATKLALHCAYEMFEGDADIRLLPEAYRVLRGGGKMVILPLYMHNFYFADSAPLADRRRLDYQGAERVWRDDGHRVRFSRKYSVRAFIERVARNLGGFTLKVYYIENEKEVSPVCYLKFAGVFEKRKIHV